jgi:hypothetical protein
LLSDESFISARPIRAPIRPGGAQPARTPAVREVTVMATLPADEDYARAVLSIFQAKNMRAWQSLRLGEVRAAFLRRNMGRIADFDAALEYAMSRDWLRLGFDMIRLTAPGAEEMETLAGFI